ncbi:MULTISPECIES: hypothetical protein [Spirulina sp. CCY15215]|uniref:hypothetical protein n=1 Tax=Spirulina sp. CCY15215 TaxID=2767591 RepID=UPI001950C363|nr:hypothetical protein [Spirulina major]
MNQKITNKNDIFQRLQEHQKVLMNFGVRRCGLFGSFRRGEATKNLPAELRAKYSQVPYKSTNNKLFLVKFFKVGVRTKANSIKNKNNRTTKVCTF